MQAPEGTNLPCDMTASTVATNGGSTYTSPNKQPVPPSHVVSASLEQRSKPKDDLDLLLLHEDFGCLVALTAKVKRARQALFERGYREAPYEPHSRSAALAPTEVMQCTARLQEQLVSKNATASTVLRGMYPITDTIMEESLVTLQHELDRCEQWLQSYQQMSPHERAVLSAQPQQAAPPAAVGRASAQKKTPTKKKRCRSSTGSSAKKKKEAIAVKYSKWQTDILMSWMIAHKDEPFPDQDEIQLLMQQTGLSQSQVVNWTTNVRKRNRKATCEGGKKPHHFIDFLFLAQDREQRDQKKSGVRTAPVKSPPTPVPSQRQVSKPTTMSPVYSYPPAVTTPEPDVTFSEPFLDRLMEDLEPLPLMDVDMSIGGGNGDQVLQEFASVWLDFHDDRATSWGGQPALLPSVTNDSTESGSSYHPGNGRAMSTDDFLGSRHVDDDDSLGPEDSDEDVRSWAAELGLGIGMNF